MRVLCVGGSRDQSGASPIRWAGLEIHVCQQTFHDIVEYNQHTPAMMPRVIRRRLADFVRSAQEYPIILCETPEALMLFAEWRHSGVRPRPMLALEVEGLLRVNAMRRWYRRARGLDPWPTLCEEPGVSWLVASEDQRGVLQNASVPSKRIFSVRGCTAYYGMFSEGIEMQLAGGPEADESLARGLPRDGVILPGGGRRDLLTMLRAVQLVPELPFFLIDELLPRKQHLLRRAGVPHLPNLFRLAPLPLQRFVALVRRARLTVVGLEAGSGDGGHTTVATAHRLGVPVVVSSVPGIVDYVTPGVDAALVPPGEPEALAEVIRRLWNDPEERRRLAQNGYQREQERCRSAAPKLIEAMDAACGGQRDETRSEP